jgi:hypothetical protein
LYNILSAGGVEDILLVRADLHPHFPAGIVVTSIDLDAHIEPSHGIALVVVVEGWETFGNPLAPVHEGRKVLPRRFPLLALLIEFLPLCKEFRPTPTKSGEFRCQGRSSFLIVERADGAEEVPLLAVHVGERTVDDIQVAARWRLLKHGFEAISDDRRMA